MNIIFRTLSMITAVAALVGCAAMSKTPGADLQVSMEAIGISAATVPGGVVQAQLGYGTLRGVLAPTTYTDSNGNQQPFLVKNACTGTNVPSIEGISNVTASASVTSNAPGVSALGGEGMYFGPVADLHEIAAIQMSYGANSPHDALSDYVACPAAIPAPPPPR